MLTSVDQALPIVRVAQIADDEIAERWLVEELWCASQPLRLAIQF